MTDHSDVQSVFYNTFVGQNVFITTNVRQTHRLTMPDGSVTETIPLYFEGLLMDIDDEFLYLGNGTNVSSAVKKYMIVEIQIKEEKDQFTKLLEEIDSPTNETDFN